MIDKKNTPTGTGTGSGMLPPDAERQLEEDAGALLDTAKSDLSQLRSEAETQAGAIAEEARAEIGKVADEAKGMAAEQKAMLAGQIDGVAQAITKVAGELEADNAATATYARTVADTVSRFSETLKTRDVDELLSMAEDFGRKQPAALMGVAAIAGFAASRFLVASARRRHDTDAARTPQPSADAYPSGAIRAGQESGMRSGDVAGRDAMGGGI